MQTIVIKRMDEKELEKKTESDVDRSDQEINDALDSNQGCDPEKQVSSSLPSTPVKNTVHVQPLQTTVFPRTLSEPSRLRILTRVPAVHSMSSTPSEESNEDLSLESYSETTRILKHQTSSKDADSESGSPSLPSSRDSSFDYTDSTGTDLNEFIIKTLRNQRDKKMLLKLEKDFLGFISDPRKVILQYPPMTSYHRMIVHRVAAYFGLDHNVDSSGKCIIVNKCPNTRYPEHRFSDLVREDSEEDPLPKLILKRQNSLSDESGPPERHNSHSRRSMEGKKSKSIEEREEEYKKARSRIFNHGSLSSQSSASSKDGESLFPGLTDGDSENEKVKSSEYSESVGNKTVDIPQPAVRVLTNRSRSPDDIPQLTLDVSLNTDASSSPSSAPLTTTGTDSNFDSSVLSQSVDTSTIASVEGAPYLARNIPVGDVSATSMVGMIPQLSPNQTGGVVWTLPDNKTAYPPGQAPIFPGHEANRPMMVSDGFQPTAVGLQPNVGPTFFFPNQGSPAGPAYQGQPAPRQPTPPVQQPQGGFSSQVFPQQFVGQTNFPVFQAPRMFNQQDLEMLPGQQTAGATGTQGVINPNAGNPNYQELNNRFAAVSINSLEQHENPGLTKQRPSTFPPGSTQTFPTGQPVQFMVYRNISGTMAVMTPVSNPGQVNPAYMYPSSTPQTFTPQGYNPQVYNQVYPQQNFNQGFPLGEQTLLPQGSGSHTPPTPPQSASPLNTNQAFIQHVQTIPGAPTRPQMPTPVMNPGVAHLQTRLMNPYGLPGQQVVQIPAGQQLYGYSQAPYAVGQNRPNLPQSARYKAYTEKGGSKSNDVYTPESSSLRQPSPSDSPRGHITPPGQSRRSSSGSGKGHGKSEGQRSHHQQGKSKQKHRKNQHKHGGDSSRKQFHSGSYHSGSSSLEMEHATDHGSCVLEVYDVIVSSRDQHQVVDDLLQAGAKISWNQKTKQSGKTLTAKATFHSFEQAEQTLQTHTNPNYKLRRCPPDIPFLESQNY
ncbi:cAMP-regulated phosphoprotein 21-like [Dendronephthya gigantea]|uniref:cAMP-regulated phosphoprotein 21-like n=1 Tax=Dendronephthya gigantea TaxID=151771 RepID=UPI00106CBF9E|nr:cAMP-regulated phosphoprotein 21-like [Dendronephthya gigantea]